MRILTPLQEDFMKALGQTSLGESFFLTGGTALSAFYLFHRYSEDLDFFTDKEGEINKVVPTVKTIAQKLKSDLNVTKEFSSFAEIFLKSEHETIKLHFAQDTPYRLQKVIKNEKYSILIDNQLDIACNKLSALFDRYAEKDFVDIYFLSKEFMPFEEIYKYAREKYIGMDEYWLAVSLKNIDKTEKLPRMIKPVTIEELRQFYYEKIKFLMKRIKK